MTVGRALKLLLVFFLIFSVDYVSKAVVNFFIPPIYLGSSTFPFGGVAVFENFLGIDFCLNLVANHGAAWGLFSAWHEPLLYLRMVAILGIVFYITLSKKSFEMHFPLTLVVAGAFGNVIDCFLYGHVIDMFHFNFWGYSFPVFNIADTSIFFGVIAIFVQSLLLRRRHVPLET